MTNSIVWGPEIRVDGKRPEWLEGSVEVDWRHADDEFAGRGRALAGRLCFEGTHVARPVAAIRLPADHPHYRQPTAPELDPALWDRIVRAIHAYASGSPELITTGRSVYAEMQALSAELPKLTDPDLIEARRIVKEVNLMSSYDYEGGTFDETPIVQAALVALKRGRALAGEQA